MRKLRIVLAEVIGLGILIGWLMWKYPELVDDIVPWVALAVLWHFTWELILDTKAIKRWSVALHKAVRPMIAWSLVFLLGGVVSLLYWWGINKSMTRLATMAAARAARIKPTPETKPPDYRATLPTLYRVFKEDAPGIFSVDFRPALLHLSKTPELTVGVEPRLHVDFLGGSKFVSFYVAPSDLTKDAGRWLAENYGLLTGINNLELISTKPGDPPISTSTIPFTKRIILYHESDLSLAEQADLEEYYKTRGLKVMLRSTAYLQSQILERQARDIKPIIYDIPFEMPAAQEFNGLSITGMTGGVPGHQVKMILHNDTSKTP
jgi:hypothetical protein